MAEPTMMKALVKQREGEGYDYTLMERPVPGVDELLLRIERVAICGSDINLFVWNEVAKVIATLPFVPGHEAVGTVVDVGAEVVGFVAGDRVCCENHFFCGQCYQCQHGRGDICKNMSQYGHGRGTPHGGCSEYSIVPARYAYKLKTPLTSAQACIMEPMGVAHNACECVEPEGDSLLIIGAGAVGLFCVAVGKTFNPSKIIVCDVVDDKLALARELGADVTVNVLKEDLHEVVMRETGGDGVGRIIEVSGAPNMVNTMFKHLRKGGHVVLVGLPKKPLHVENPLPDVVFKSLTLKTIHGRRIFHTWEACERLLAAGKVDISKIVTHDLPMSSYKHAFDVLMGGRAIKILMDPSK